MSISIYDFDIEIRNYIALEEIDPKHKVYLENLFNSLSNSLQHKNFIGFYFCSHILFMNVILQKIWQLHQVHPKMIDFSLKFQLGKKFEGKLWGYRKIKETQLINFFNLIDIGDDEIKLYCKLIEDRNQYAHASGETVLDEASLEVILDKYVEFLRIFDENENVVKMVLPLWDEYFISTLKPFLDDGNVIDQTIKEEFIKPNLLNKNDICELIKINLIQNNIDIANYLANEYGFEIEDNKLKI